MDRLNAKRSGTGEDDDDDGEDRGECLAPSVLKPK